uniref:Uncharacterized protein n=1 Tax=Arundo donax TaxID=35708 RepID=A0A0A9C6N9_ARUDO
MLLPLDCGFGFGEGGGGVGGGFGKIGGSSDGFTDSTRFLANWLTCWRRSPKSPRIPSRPRLAGRGYNPRETWSTGGFGESPPTTQSPPCLWG